jgi:hypothetical protein
MLSGLKLGSEIVELKHELEVQTSKTSKKLTTETVSIRPNRQRMEAHPKSTSIASELGR